MAASAAAVDALKQRGNELFAKGKYGAAIDTYTEAITLAPSRAVLFLNRAMATKKLADAAAAAGSEVAAEARWRQVAADAEAALRLDGALHKARYLLGQALRRGGRERLPEACRQLLLALEGARSAGDAVREEIFRALAGAEHELHTHEAARRAAEAAELRAAFSSLSPALPAEAAARLRAQLDALLERDAARDAPTEVPSAFTCALTLQPFRDPVLTPSGCSYERALLLAHLAKSGTDPVTRAELRPEQLVPNLALQQAVMLWLREHPAAWADCV